MPSSLAIARLQFLHIRDRATLERGFGFGFGFGFRSYGSLGVMPKTFTIYLFFS